MKTTESPAGPPAESGAGARASHPHHARPHKHRAEIAHTVAGRLRIKVPTARTHPQILEIYKAAFSAIPGIREVRTKPETGSIVIYYDPERHAEFHDSFHAVCAEQQVPIERERPGDEIEAVARKIQAEAEFLAQRSEVAKSTVEFFKKFDVQLRTLSGNSIDLKIVLAGGLAAYTFLEIGADAATPMWVTLALFSLNHFAELQSHPSPATGTVPAVASPSR